MKKILTVLGLLLMILGSITLIFFIVIPVAALYIFAGLLLVIYAKYFEKVKIWLHCLAIIIFLIPASGLTFLAVYGSIHTTDFSEDVVFVLGAGLRNDEILSSLGSRLNQAVVYFQHNPDAIFIVCGGYGEGQSISEARAMANFLIAHGIPEAQIILEDASTSTYENFRFAIEILEAYFPDGFSSVIITNAFHQYRSGYLARYLGINPTRFGSSTPISMLHTSYVREMLAVINTWLFQTSIN